MYEDIVGSLPTSMTLIPGQSKLAIATFGATEFVVIDLEAPLKSIVQTYTLASNPYRISVSSNGQFAYAEQDAFGRVILGDLQTGSVLASTRAYESDILFDTTGVQLFAGESANAGSYLRRFNVSANEFISTGATAETYFFPTRRIFMSGTDIYFASRKFNSSSLLPSASSFGEEIIYLTHNGKFAISSKNIYNTTSFTSIQQLPFDANVLASNASDTKLYIFNSNSGSFFVIDLSSL